MARPPERALPRLSAAQLADYLAAPTVLAQIGILRAAKYPTEARPLIIQYQHARRAIASCLAAPADTNRLVAAAVVALEQRRDDPASRPLVRDDARRSIDAILNFQRSVNQLDLEDVTFEPALQRPQSLMIRDVEISVSCDAVAIVASRNGPRVGEVFVRCAIGNDGDAAENRRLEASGHLATVAHIHATAHLAERGTPHSPSSMVIDVPRQRVIRGPASTTARVRNIEAACGMISAVWPTV
jgi:hypothetical protein